MLLFGEEIATSLILAWAGEVLEVLNEVAHDVSLPRLHDFEARILLENEWIEFDEFVTLNSPIVCVSVG